MVSITMLAAVTGLSVLVIAYIIGFYTFALFVLLSMPGFIIGRYGVHPLPLQVAIRQDLMRLRRVISDTVDATRARRVMSTAQ